MVSSVRRHNGHTTLSPIQLLKLASGSNADTSSQRCPSCRFVVDTLFSQSMAISSSSSSSDGPFGANADIGVGFTDKALLVVSVAGMCLLAATIYAVVLVRVKTRQEMDNDHAATTAAGYDEKLARADVSKLTRAQRRARARFLMKQQRRVVVPSNINNNNAAVEGNADEAIVAVAPEEQQEQQGPVLSRKERQRAAKAAEKENRRLFEEERRKQQQEAQKIAQEEKRERVRKEARRAEEVRQQKEAEKEELKRKERLEWETFLSGPERTQTVEELVGQLKQERYITVDETAERFSTTPDVVRERIERLVNEERVAGVFEEDQFIYFSDDELKAIADQVLKADSSSLSDIAGMCNNLCSSKDGV